MSPSGRLSIQDDIILI